MHLILQMYLGGILRKRDLSTFYILHFKNNVKSKAPTLKIYQKYFEQGFQYLDKFCFPEREILGVEEKLFFNVAKKPFVGYIDVISNDGGLIITDHKSRILKPRSNRKKPTKHDEELDAYFKQLYLYSVAIKDKYGKYPDFLEFNCFRSQAIIREPFDIERLHSVEEWAGNKIEQITSNEEWVARPDYWRCNYLCDVCSECEYKNI